MVEHQNMRSMDADIDALNKEWHNRCCVFFDNGRRRVGIVEEFHHGANIVTVTVGAEVHEVPRHLVYL